MGKDHCPLTTEEQETVIRFDRRWQDAEITTTNPAVAEKLRAIGLHEQKPLGPTTWRFRVHKRAIAIRPHHGPTYHPGAAGWTSGEEGPPDR